MPDLTFLTQMDLTPFLQAILSLIAIVITAFIIPWIKTKRLEGWIAKGVRAAQQLAKKNNWDGESKKNYVLEFLAKKGYKIDVVALEISIDAMIEAAVYELKK